MDPCYPLTDADFRTLRALHFRFMLLAEYAAMKTSIDLKSAEFESLFEDPGLVLGQICDRAQAVKRNVKPNWWSEVSGGAASPG